MSPLNHQEIFNNAKKVDDILDRGFKASSVLRFAEERTGRRVIVHPLSGQINEPSSGTLLIHEDVEKPIFIFAPPEVEDGKDDSFFRFCIYHEIGHIVLEDVERITSEDGNPWFESEEEWKRASCFAVALLNLRGDPNGKTYISQSDLVQILNRLNRIKLADWMEDVLKTMQMVMTERENGNSPN